MEAMLVTNRTINTDRFFNKRKEEEYEKHIKKIQQIRNTKEERFKTIETDNEKISNVLKKAKESVKQFQEKEKYILRKHENKCLLERLWKISEGAYAIDTARNEEPARKVGHHSEFQKKLSQKILEANKILTKNIIEQNKHKKSKSQIKEEMKEYLAIRDNIRKLKSPSEKKKHSQSRVFRSQSEAKHNKFILLEPAVENQEEPNK